LPTRLPERIALIEECEEKLHLVGHARNAAVARPDKIASMAL
jgi:hypothetical protein